MAENTGLAPIAKAGTLTDNDFGDYASPQELLDAFAEVLEISTEAGETGATGETGEAGDPAPASNYEMVLEKAMPIPLAVDQLDTLIDLDGKVLRITAPASQATLPAENFCVGVIEGSVVHFVFTDTAAALQVSRLGWLLEIWGLQGS